MGQDQQKAHIILNGNFFCLSCPSATFASQHGGFVPREWHANNQTELVENFNFLSKKKGKNFYICADLSSEKDFTF